MTGPISGRRTDPCETGDVLAEGQPRHKSVGVIPAAHIGPVQAARLAGGRP